MKIILSISSILLLINFSEAQTSISKKAQYVFASYSADIPWWSKNGFYDQSYTGQQYPSDELTTEVCLSSPTDTIFFTDFGFNIPTDAEIAGVTLNLYKIEAFNNDVKDTLVSLWNNEVISSNLAIDNTWLPDSVVYEYGATDDLWNSNLTPEIVNSSSFGIAFQMKTLKWCTGATLGNIELTIHLKSPVLSTDMILETNDLSIFPNPTSGNFTIDSYRGIVEAYRILGTNGELVSDKITSNGSIEINTSNLNKGIYFIQVMIGGNWITKKIVIE